MKLWHWLLIGGGALYLLTRPKTAAASGEPRVNLLNQQLVALGGGASITQEGNKYRFTVTSPATETTSAWTGSATSETWTDLIDSLAASLEDSSLSNKAAMLEIVRPARDWK